MASRRAAGRTSITVDSSDFQRLYAAAQRFPRDLRQELTGQLGDAARPAARSAAQAALKLRLPATRRANYPQVKRSTGLRQGLAKGVRVIVRDAAGGAEYRIVARHEMSRVTNTQGWRHPTFGNRSAEGWVGQRSWPWFDRSTQRHVPGIRAAAQQALHDAIAKVDV